jgi:hypothetical protein
MLDELNSFRHSEMTREDEVVTRANDGELKGRRVRAFHDR